MKMERTMFQSIKVVGRKRVNVDGRMMRRQKTFRQNIDLFNVDDSGRPKFYDQIKGDLLSQAYDWERSDHKGDA